MSKIYEALKRAEQLRETAQRQPRSGETWLNRGGDSDDQFQRLGVAVFHIYVFTRWKVAPFFQYVCSSSFWETS